MKLLVVHPGASFSTHDVYVGLTEALRLRGHEIYDYALDGRIEASGRWLTYCWKRGNKTCERPGPADIQYHAGEQLVARALRVMPDWVLVVSGMYLHPDVFVLLRRAGIRVAILFTESPYDDERQERLLPWVSAAWTNERTTAERWGIGYVAHAYRPALHNTELAVDEAVPAHDVVFVGTGFQERIDLLGSVDWEGLGIDFALYGAWEMLPSRHVLRKYIRGKYRDNTEATALYRRAKIGLNLYRQSKGFGRQAPRIAVAESMNPRAYELAATGCFTVSDHRAEVVDVFGSAVPMFKGADELAALVQYWLAHESERREIAAHLPSLVRPHTWLERAARIEADLLRTIEANPQVVAGVA
jgi:spore maturation protein CgeB